MEDDRPSHSPWRHCPYHWTHWRWKVLGVIFGLAAAFIYSIYILVGSKITKQVTAIQSSTVVIVSAAIVSGGLVAIKGPAFPATASGWASVIAIALISTILAIVTFFAGLERVGPTTASTPSPAAPPARA